MRVSERLGLLPGKCCSTKPSAATLGGGDAHNIFYLWTRSRVQMRRGECTMVLPLHDKGEGQAGKQFCFRWSWLLRCRALSFLLRKKRVQKAQSGFPLSSHLSLCQLCFCLCIPALMSQWRPHPYINPLVSHIPWSLTYLVSFSLHPYLLWFSEVERWLWEGKFVFQLLGGVSSPLACSG